MGWGGEDAGRQKQNGRVGTICIIILVSATISAGVLTLQQRGARLRVPIATLVIALVVAVVSVAGELSSDVLAALGRDLPALPASGGAPSHRSSCRTAAGRV